MDKCETGCKVFTGGEIRHHPDCVYYPESLSKMYDDKDKRIAELKLRLTEAEQNLSDMTDFRDHWKVRAEKAEAQLAELKSAWAGTKFVSSDKDNMEFNVRITYWQKETLQDILK